MIYLWNFANWCFDMLPTPLQQSRHLAWINVLIEPVRELHVEFLIYRSDLSKRLRINGQTVVLENLLNDFFDSINRGIEIITSFDTIDPIFIGQPSEFASNPTFFGQPSEPPPILIGQPEEYGVAYDFMVIVPDGILTPGQEVQLKSVIKKYKFLSKKPLFKYVSGTQF
jgi:hypothetical protein